MSTRENTRSFYPSRQHKQSDVPQEFVHADVWGPCHVVSMSRFRYFVIFVDDFSRMTWVYLKDRTQVFYVINFFFNEIKNQFSKLLCIFHIDNALKYVHHDVSLLCESQGVIHQTSYPRTSLTEWYC